MALIDGASFFPSSRALTNVLSISQNLRHLSIGRHSGEIRIPEVIVLTVPRAESGTFQKQWISFTNGEKNVMVNSPDDEWSSNGMGRNLVQAALAVLSMENFKVSNCRLC